MESFSGQTGKYWRLEGDGICVDGDEKRDGFYLELREPTRICIRLVFASIGASLSRWCFEEQEEVKKYF